MEWYFSFSRCAKQNVNYITKYFFREYRRIVLIDTGLKLSSESVYYVLYGVSGKNVRQQIGEWAEQHVHGA